MQFSAKGARHGSGGGQRFRFLKMHDGKERHLR